MTKFGKQKKGWRWNQLKWKQQTLALFVFLYNKVDAMAFDGEWWKKIHYFLKSLCRKSLQRKQAKVKAIWKEYKIAFGCTVLFDSSVSCKIHEI